LGSYGNRGEFAEPLGTYENPRGTLRIHGSEDLEDVPKPLAVIPSVTCFDLRLNPQNGVRCIGIGCLSPYPDIPKESQGFAKIHQQSQGLLRYCYDSQGFPGVQYDSPALSSIPKDCLAFPESTQDSLGFPRTPLSSRIA
jgi:hypothetical protein